MANDDIGGVWRTVGGRRIFIKDGQSLSEAMKESGKFLKKKEVIEAEQIIEKLKKMKERNTNLNEEFEKVQKQLNRDEDEYLKARQDWIKQKYPEVYEKRNDEKKIEYRSIRENYDKEQGKDFEIEHKEIYKKYNSAIEEYRRYYDKNIEAAKKYSYEKQLKEYLVKEANGYEEIAEAMYTSTNKSYDKLVKFGEIAKKENYVISKSPYGSSMYAIPKGDVVDWGYKPMDSYRIADHWGFESRGEIHCRLGNNDEYITDFEIGKWNGKYYEKI